MFEQYLLAMIKHCNHPENTLLKERFEGSRENLLDALDKMP